MKKLTMIIYPTFQNQSFLTAPQSEKSSENMKLSACFAEEIAGRVEVVSRGGTVLQPGIDLLESAKDFPKDGPVLIITDGYIERDLKITREYAFLIPEGHILPFKPSGEVFYYEK